MNTNLLRQRRNVISLSSGLLLFDFAKVTITNVSVMGTELLVGDVKVLIYFAWMLWGYFLLRYYQYLRVETDLGISATFKSQFDGQARAYVFQELGREWFSGNVEFKRHGIRWAYSVKEYIPGTDSNSEVEGGPLPIYKAVWWLLTSIYYVTVHTPKATDHILPFMLAIAAAVVSGIRVIQGG